MAINLESCSLTSRSMCFRQASNGSTQLDWTAILHCISTQTRVNLMLGCVIERWPGKPFLRISGTFAALLAASVLVWHWKVPVLRILASTLWQYLELTAFFFLIHCCAHHHDSGSYNRNPTEPLKRWDSETCCGSDVSKVPQYIFSSMQSMKQKTLIKIGFLCSKNLPPFVFSFFCSQKPGKPTMREPKRWSSS